MDHGFRKEHFDLLTRWGDHHYDGKDPVHAAAKAGLATAYEATERWARALQARKYPAGSMHIRKATINQGQFFSPYTWAKIYPSQSALEDLAITVGIDADGYMVKLDTVNRPAFRPRYLELRGPTNRGSPFASILNPEQGLAMSLEQLVDWSAPAIDAFAIGYDELAALMGIKGSALTLVRDPPASREAFARWRSAMIERAIPKGSLSWLPEGRIVIRETRSQPGADADGMELGVHPQGHQWAVQINEPRIPGDHNSLSAIGVNGAGERLLLRQGFLRPSPPGSPTIFGDEFIRRTGLTPVAVKAEGLAALRIWFEVCNLDASPEMIVKQTSAFVDRCAEARASAAAGKSPASAAGEDKFATGERGGTFVRHAQEADAKLVVRRHGIVWLALADVLGKGGLRVRKGRHVLGYEVDAEVDGKAIPPLLIEIKTNASSGDLHSGVGQLHLYARLFPRLSEYEKVLLLPRLPPADVCSAAAKCGVTLHLFAFGGSDEDPDVRLSSALLERCGIEPAAAAAAPAAA